MTGAQKFALEALMGFADSVEQGRYGQDDDIDTIAFWDDFSEMRDEIGIWIDPAG